MNGRRRTWALGALTVVALGAAITYAGLAIAGYESRATAVAEPTSRPAVPQGQQLVFRDTSPGAHYGEVASVPLSAPSAARTSLGVHCDRVYATHENLMCLHTDPGTVTSFGATLYDSTGAPIRSWPLPGFPSRTRISPDGSLVAQTSFVTGSSYGTAGFDTKTTISAVSGIDYGNLEGFSLFVNGQKVSADRIIWGVTFASDDNTFFATASSGGHDWLVRGNLRARTLVAVKDGAECPSLSPDGTRVAYKKNISTTATKHWTLAVLDFATGAERELPIPPSVSVDDQAEWLDDGTVLYGLADGASSGDSTVYSVLADGSAPPAVFLRHAWSPSVVR